MFSPFEIPNLRVKDLKGFCKEHGVKSRKVLRYLQMAALSHLKTERSLPKHDYRKLVGIVESK